MSTGTKILILTQWCGVVLPALADDPGASVLRETIELARTVAAAADPCAVPGIVAALADLDHRNDNSSPLFSLNDWARHQLEYVVHPDTRSAPSAPGFEPWWRATDILGSVEVVLGDEAEAGFEECERIFAQHAYAWTQPSGTRGNRYQLPATSSALLRLPADASELDDDGREDWPERHEIETYLLGALAEAGGDAAGERRVLIAAAEALLEAQLADVTACFKRKLTLLREARLDGRALPAVVSSYNRIMVDRDSGPGPTRDAAEQAYEARFAPGYEAEYLFHFAIGDRPATERLTDMLDAIDSMHAFGETNGRVLAAALAALRGKR